NVRLFDEVQARTRELTESLEQQIASADLFRIISGLTFQLQPVLDELVKSAARLFQAEKIAVFLGDGELFRVAARHGFPSTFQQYFEAQPIPLPQENIAEQSSVGSRLVHIPDIMADPEFTWQEVQKNAFLRGLLGSGIARAGVIADCRAFLSVPLLREGILIGTIVAARTVPQSFTAKQIELMTTFADQAGIDIENVRLFDELQARTRQISRSVEELRALGEVGQVLNSTLDVDTVLTTIVAKAVELSGTEAGAIYTLDEATQKFELRSTYGMD